MIYFNLEAVYVGQSSDVRKRIASHRFEYTISERQRTPWGIIEGDVFITVRVRDVEKYGDWAMHELRLIKRLEPRFNKHHKGGKLCLVPGLSATPLDGLQT